MFRQMSKCLSTRYSGKRQLDVFCDIRCIEQILDDFAGMILAIKFHLSEDFDQ